jgi:hypothetical protein
MQPSAGGLPVPSLQLLCLAAAPAAGLEQLARDRPGIFGAAREAAKAEGPAYIAQHRQRLQTVFRVQKQPGSTEPAFGLLDELRKLLSVAHQAAVGKRKRSDGDVAQARLAEYAERVAACAAAMWEVAQVERMEGLLPRVARLQTQDELAAQVAAAEARMAAAEARVAAAEARLHELLYAPPLEELISRLSAHEAVQAPEPLYSGRSLLQGSTPDDQRALWQHLRKGLPEKLPGLSRMSRRRWRELPLPRAHVVRRMLEWPGLDRLQAVLRLCLALYMVECFTRRHMELARTLAGLRLPAFGAQGLGGNFFAFLLSFLGWE